MDYSSLSQPWQQQQKQNQRIPLRRSASYFYAHHPENWELVLYTQSKKDEKKTKTTTIPVLLPLLSTMPEEAGVNGVRMNGSRVDSTLFHGRLRQSGWTILDPARHDYMRVYPASNGGNYFSNRFTTIENLAGRIIKTFDQESYNDFRKGLMRDQHISLPHKAIIQLLLIDQNKTIEGLEQRQHTPEGAARLKEAYAKYKHIEQAAERVYKLKEKAYVV